VHSPGQCQWRKSKSLLQGLLDCLALHGFPRRSRNLGVSSDQFPLLARPFFRVNPGPQFGESTEVVARPGQSTGGVQVHSSAEFWGVEPSLRTSAAFVVIALVVSTLLAAILRQNPRFHAMMTSPGRGAPTTWVTTISPIPAYWRMFRASSEIAVAIRVSSLDEKPSRPARTRPF